MLSLPDNPVLPGYYADPSLVEFDGRFYLYATIDPWGGNSLACWESTDFETWTFRKLNWPTKAACTSSTSLASKVWAPSVVQATDGNFFMYISVGSEVWAGIAPHPLGPWTDVLEGRPLIPSTWDVRYHMIDAECFLDEDGRAYLYWGSGLNWVNGRCFAVELDADMVSFKGEVLDVTPSRYFEAPFMHRRGDLYYLSYSSGRTTEDTYQVHCATGTHPLGPFTEQANSPILATDVSKGLISPGHHAIFRKDGEDYILYHRRKPYLKETLRQICVDQIGYDTDGQIMKVNARV